MLCEQCNKKSDVILKYPVRLTLCTIKSNSQNKYKIQSTLEDHNCLETMTSQDQWGVRCHAKICMR